MEVAEKSTVENPVGLYRHSESGQYIGAVDPIQADAFVRNGFKLYKAGTEAATLSQDEIDKLGTKRKEV